MLSIYVVDSLADSVAADGLVTLREALEAANTNTAVYDAAAGSDVDTDVITFAAELFGDGGNPTPGTIALDGQQLEITDNLSIEGPGAELLTIDANQRSRVFFVAENVSASIDGLAIVDGLAAEPAEDTGGGISNYGSLILTDSIVSHNTATYRGGAIYNSATGTVLASGCLFFDNSADAGGAIFSFGIVDLDHSSVLENSADDGAGIYSTETLTVTNSTIAGNSASEFGGGLRAWDALTIINSTIVSNSARVRGGGCMYENGSTDPIYSNSIFALNTADISPDFNYRWGSVLQNNFFGICESYTPPNDSNVWGTPETPLDPKLTAVSDETGRVAYYRPRPDSLAIDGGRDDLAVDSQGSPLSTDIIGNTRILGDHVDMGSVEWTSAVELVVSPLSAIEIIEGESATVDVSLTMEPAAEVTVTVGKRVDDSDGLSCDTTVLNFNTENWQIAQTVTISASEDTDRVNDRAVFSFASDSGDTLRISVTAVDNDPQTFVVDSLADAVAADGVVTLREALQAANTNANVGDAPAGCEGFADTITFAPALQGGTIVLDQGELVVSDDIHIQGPGSGLLTIDANSQSRVFKIGRNAEVLMSGLTITGGLAEHDVDDGDGGGIINLGNLTINDLTITDNSAFSDGGGIYNKTGILTINNSAVTNNSAGESGFAGGIGSGTGGLIYIAETNISGNSARFGGGVYAANYSAMSIDNSTIADNHATQNGGGIYTSADTNISGTNVYGNHAEEGGGLYVWAAAASLANTIIVGNAAEVAGGIFVGNYYNASVVATNSTIAANTALQSGGGVYNYSLSKYFSANNSIIALNEAPSGADLRYSIDEQSGHNLVARDPLFMRRPSHGGDGWGDDPDTADVDESANDDFGDLRLWERSPGLNAGSNELAVDADGEPLATDYFGDLRIQEETVDIGAIEGGLPNENLFVVDSLADDTTVDGLITLREAVEAASTNLPVGDAPAGTSNGSDVITFDPALFDDGSGATPQTISLLGSLLDLHGYIDIIGPGADLLTVDADGLSQVLYNHADAVTIIRHITLSGGLASTANGSPVDDGGGIINFGDLSVSDATISANSADGSGGGIFNFATLRVSNANISGNSASNGGGIFSTSEIEILDSTMENNTASDSGGGVYGLHDLHVSGSTISGNSADGDGGGVFNSRNLHVTGSIISDNSAGGNGGGVFNFDNISVSETTVSGNTAAGSGGGIHIERDTTLPERYTNIQSCTISDNTAGTDGGGIYLEDHLDISNSTISANRAVNGGGIYCDDGTDYTYGYKLTVLNSSILTNTAVEKGGGVYSDDLFYLTNSLMVGNAADIGGAIHDDHSSFNSQGTTTVTSSNILFNTANQYGGISTIASYLRLENSILAFNDNGDLPVVYNPRGGGNIIALDPWFVDNPSHGGDGWGDDPATTGIDESANDYYGDLHLRLGSPAIDRGDDSLLPEDLLTDWDGNPRIYGDTVDAGIYEYQTPPQPDREEPSLTVDTTDDIFDLHDGAISLREAIYYAGTTGLGSDVEFDPLVFDPATPGYTITLDGLALYVGSPLTIDATGLGLTIDGGGRSRVFYTQANDVELVGLRISGGSAFNGGGIYSTGTLSLVNALVVGNTAYGYGGGIFNDNRWVWTANTTIAGNVAREGGGICGLSGVANIRNTIVALNEADVSANLAGELNYYSMHNYVGDDAVFVRAPSHGGDGWGDNPATPAIDESSNDDHGDLHLLYRDDTVNAGDNDRAENYSGEPLLTDFDGNDRIVCETVDIGAFEYNGTLAHGDHFVDLAAGETHVLAVLANDNIPSGSSASIEIVQEPSWGTAATNGDGTVSYQTYYDLGWTDSFSYRMYVDGQEYNVVTVTVDTTGKAPLCVSTTEDLVDNVWSPGQMSLREALEITDDIAGKDTICFDASLNNGQIILDDQSLSVSDDVDILGPGHELLTLDANSISRIFEIGEGVEAGIYDLLIRSGYAEDGNGGAILNSGTLHIENSTITYSTADLDGGGIYSNPDSVLSIENSTVFNNVSEGKGGGVFAHGELSVVSSTVDLNRSTLQGGGIYIVGNNSTISNSTISNNRSEGSGQAFGGGIHVHGNLDLDESLVLRNYCRDYGGGIYVTNGSLAVRQSTIQANSTYSRGGGIFSQGAEVIVSESKILGNHAYYWAGGIDTHDSSSLRMDNSLVVGNNSLAGYAGGMYVTANSTIVNSTIVANADPSYEPIRVTVGRITMQNSIVGDQHDEIILEGLLDEDSGNNMFGIDPFFVRNPDSGGDGWGDNPQSSHDESANDDYGDLRLLSHSPAVNFGNDSFSTSATDLEGNPRIHDTAVDAGAYEYQGDLPGSRETPSMLVNTTDDGFDLYDSQTSLREAIWYAREYNAGTEIQFDPAVFDPVAAPHQILLSGGQLYVDCDITLNASGIGGLTIDPDNNSRALFVAAGNVAIEEIVITHGSERKNGTAILNNGSISINNCTITENTSDYYSATIHNMGDMSIFDSEITDNSAYESGHGIFNDNNASLLARNCTVARNSKHGIANSSGSMTVVDSVISDNGSIGISNSGTAILSNLIVERNNCGVYCSGDSTLSNVTVRDSYAYFFNGGGIAVCGIMTLVDSTIANNITIAKGGGIYIQEGGALNVINSAIYGNSANNDDRHGGGIYVDEGTLFVSNSVITGNSTNERGGGIYSYYGIVDVINSTIAGNSADRGGGVYFWATEVTMYNSIVSHNSARSNPNYSGFSGNSVCNLIDDDPLFIRNPSDGGDGWGDDPETTEIDESANDDYGDLRLCSSSPAINAGDNDRAVDAQGNPLIIDVAGNTRIMFDIVDIGAYEFQGIPGDANSDGTVDVCDLGALSTNYGTTSGAKWGDSDFTGDGAVDVCDLGILSTNYGQTQTPATSATAAGASDVPCDLDNDGQISLGDLAFFASVYGERPGVTTDSSYAYAADFDGSGTVDLGDLAIFSANYRTWEKGLGTIHTEHSSGREQQIEPDHFSLVPVASRSSTVAPQTAFAAAVAEKGGSNDLCEAPQSKDRLGRRDSLLSTDRDPAYGLRGRVTDDDIATLARYWMMAAEGKDDDAKRDAFFAEVGEKDEALCWIE